VLAAALLAALGWVNTACAQSNLPPVITSQPQDLVVTSPGNGSFTVGVTGLGPFTYQWFWNGSPLPNSIITTVAGNGMQGYSGDGGAATNARLDYPTSVVVNQAGNLFILDTGNQRMREVNSHGIITIVGGNGSVGFNGDGLLATNSSLNTTFVTDLADTIPSSLATGGYESLVFSDTDNERVRLAAYGRIITIAGNRISGYAGDGGPAYNAEFAGPGGVALDGHGNVLVCDTENQRVRKVDANDRVATVAGNGTHGYAGDGGLATTATLDYPSGLAMDRAGNLFIGDNSYGSGRIRKVATNGIISTVAGGGGHYPGDGGMATNASLNAPTAVVVDTYGRRIRKVNPAGIISTVAGNGTYNQINDGGAATNASLAIPRGVAVDLAGNLFIADTGAARIRKVTPAGPVLTLANINSTNAGPFRVIISNDFGSVTSRVATLTITLPQIAVAALTNSPP